MSPQSFQPTFRQGFTPGSLESIRAVQMEHRYEGKASAEQQAAILSPVGKRILAHTWQAQMDARNVSVMKRQLQGRRSAAALEWLLKRQQERQHVEQETHRPHKHNVLALHRTSPDNPFSFWREQQQQQEPPAPSPAEMAALLAAMQLAGDSSTPAAPDAAAAADGAQQPASNSDDAATTAAAPATATAAAPSKACAASAAEVAEAAAVLDAAADAVAVIVDDAEPVCCQPAAVAPHLVGHMATGSLSPEPQPGSPTGQTPAHAAAEAAYWKQQELEELMSALLQEYPHGIPKKMLMDLKQLGVSDAPALGFGCISSSLTLDSVLLTKKP